MLTTLLVSLLAVISLALVLLLLPILLLQRFVSSASGIDEVEESWMRRFGDLEPPFIDAEVVRRLRSISVRG